MCVYKCVCANLSSCPCQEQAVGAQTFGGSARRRDGQINIGRLRQQIQLAGNAAAKKVELLGDKRRMAHSVAFRCQWQISWGGGTNAESRQGSCPRKLTHNLTKILFKLVYWRVVAVSHIICNTLVQLWH